jgi:hypothetical protein
MEHSDVRDAESASHEELMFCKLAIQDRQRLARSVAPGE